MYQLTNLKLVFFKILVLITLFGYSQDKLRNDSLKEKPNNIFSNTLSNITILVRNQHITILVMD